MKMLVQSIDTQEGISALLLRPMIELRVQVAGYNFEEEAVLDFRIEYHGGRAASVLEPAEVFPSSDPIGRCYTLPATIRFLPSLQVGSFRQALDKRTSFMPRSPLSLCSFTILLQSHQKLHILCNAYVYQKGLLIMHINRNAWPCYSLIWLFLFSAGLHA